MGPRAVLGLIYQVLEFGREDVSYDRFRQLVGDFIRISDPKQRPPESVARLLPMLSIIVKEGSLTKGH